MFTFFAKVAGGGNGDSYDAAGRIEGQDLGPEVVCSTKQLL